MGIVWYDFSAPTGSDGCAGSARLPRRCREWILLPAHATRNKHRPDPAENAPSGSVPMLATPYGRSDGAHAWLWQFRRPNRPDLDRGPELPQHGEHTQQS